LAMDCFDPRCHAGLALLAQVRHDASGLAALFSRFIVQEGSGLRLTSVHLLAMKPMAVRKPEKSEKVPMTCAEAPTLSRR